MAIRKILANHCAADAATFIGHPDELFYDPQTTTLRRSDGVTPGGVIFGYLSVDPTTLVLTNDPRLNQYEVSMKISGKPAAGAKYSHVFSKNSVLPSFTQYTAAFAGTQQTAASLVVAFNKISNNVITVLGTMTFTKTNITTTITTTADPSFIPTNFATNDVFQAVFPVVQDPTFADVSLSFEFTRSS